MVPRNCPLQLFIEPLGTVDKATPTWWRLILDARISNEFHDACVVWYFSVLQLAALLDVCEVMFAEDLEDAYHLSIFSGCTVDPSSRACSPSTSMVRWSPAGGWAWAATSTRASVSISRPGGTPGWLWNLLPGSTELNHHNLDDWTGPLPATQPLSRPRPGQAGGGATPTMGPPSLGARPPGALAAAPPRPRCAPAPRPPPLLPPRLTVPGTAAPSSYSRHKGPDTCAPSPSLPTLIAPGARPADDVHPGLTLHHLLP
jgi:hypothetical protein